MSYFNFSAYNKKVIIPKSRVVGKKKEKSCFVNHNKISKIKDAESLYIYNSMFSERVN